MMSYMYRDKNMYLLYPPHAQFSTDTPVYIYIYLFIPRGSFQDPKFLVSLWDSGFVIIIISRET